MAKKGKIETNEKRKQIAERFRDKRQALKETIRSPKSSDEERMEAQIKLQSMPRDASATRIRNRCRVTGRPRGYYRKFQMSRISLRDHGLRGEIAGLTKSSW